MKMKSKANKKSNLFLSLTFSFIERVTKNIWTAVDRNKNNNSAYMYLHITGTIMFKFDSASALTRYGEKNK